MKAIVKVAKIIIMGFPEAVNLTLREWEKSLLKLEWLVHLIIKEELREWD